MQRLAQGCPQPPRSSPTIGMAMSHTGDMHGHHVPPSNNTVLGAVRSVVAFLNATRDAMQARDPHHFRACITTQVGMLKNTIRRLNPDHADAANATIELRTSACFNDDERNDLLDALNVRMSQLTDIVAVTNVRCRDAMGQTCLFFFNYCTAVFWARVMNLAVPLGDAIEAAACMAIAIDLRHPKESTIGIMLSTIFCARNEQFKVEPAFYYEQMGILRGVIAAKRAHLPPTTYAIMQKYPADPAHFVV